MYATSSPQEAGRDAGQGLFIRRSEPEADVTERKQTEEAFRQAESEKTQLFAKGVDELRNALAPIRTAVKILHLQSGTAPEPLWALEIMDRQIRQLAAVIDDLEHAVAPHCSRNL